MLKKAWIAFLYWVTRGLLGIRYRLQVRGLEKLKPEALPKKGGIVFLPNHPAEIDPVLMIMVLWRKYQPHAIIVDNFYYLKGFHYILKLVECIPLPDFQGTVNKWKQKKIEQALASIRQKLAEKSNFLIYPSGKLKRTGEEVIGGASFVHTLLQQCPDANVVLVRTTGLWGSRFSRALTGTTPDFAKVIGEGIKIVLKNLIFLTPRREVTVELEAAPADLPIQASRLEFNRYLERWYNRRGAEPMKLVTDCFWKDSFPKVEAPPEEAKEEENWTIAPEIEREIIAKIGALAHRSDIQRSQHLNRDLGLDSLDLAQLNTYLEQRFEIEEVEELETVESVLKAAAKKEKLRQAPQLAEPEKRWPSEEARPLVAPPAGKTLHEAFLRSCDRMDSFAACADETLGIVTYRRLKMIVLILSRKIRQMEEDHIGILLPSSVMAYALVFAILLAKKTPVMLNWTLGARALDHCKQAAALKTVFSSRRFLNNMPNGDLEGIDPILVLLEEFRETISLGDKFKGLFGLLKNTDTLLKDLELSQISEDDTAVILFTSGTEALPKGVPLSHKNILSDLTAALSCITLFPTDVLYGVLPPFHSFGFSVTGVFPLLAGLKVYYAPDPTHTRSMLHDLENWKVTLFVSAPTFIKGVFSLATPQQLLSLRYAVGGAEKVPDELFDFMEKRGQEMLEGYGITECAPIVTMTRPKKPRKGVGQPVPGVDLCIVSPETREVLLPGQVGEICICGPNVFNGYLGAQKFPFIELDGRRWYLSGDLGSLDDDGSLVLAGRLKRFVKIGGEMISLGGLEEELLHMAREKKWIPEVQDEAPPLAVAVKEKNTEKPLIILFSTYNLNKDDINQTLRDRGYSALTKIADVRQVAQIPLTGTGKIHYHALDELL